MAKFSVRREFALREQICCEIVMYVIFRYLHDMKNERIGTIIWSSYYEQKLYWNVGYEVFNVFGKIGMMQRLVRFIYKTLFSF